MMLMVVEIERSIWNDLINYIQNPAKMVSLGTGFLRTRKSIIQVVQREQRLLE